MANKNDFECGWGIPGQSGTGRYRRQLLKMKIIQLIASISEKIGNTTNNQAEYRALIAGLKKAISLGAKQITVNSDSELMVKQLLGSIPGKESGT